MIEEVVLIENETSKIVVEEETVNRTKKRKN
jgi:hypothetical protein